ncbi:MAG: hypothetical protein ACO3SP_00880 [Ilumatobacteraceae bacterium]
MDVAEVALVANLAATAVMVGVIWFVQRVHYPLLALVGTDRASGVALEHQRRTGQVVGLPMAVEGVSTLVLLVERPVAVSFVWPWAGAVLLAVALGCTIVLSVPLHSRMATTPDDAVGRSLVRTNWPRTLAWTMRGAVCVIMLIQVLGGS